MYFHKPDFSSNKVWLVEGFIDVDAVFISLSLLLSYQDHQSLGGNLVPVVVFYRSLLWLKRRQ